MGGVGVSALPLSLVVETLLGLRRVRIPEDLSERQRGSIGHLPTVAMGKERLRFLKPAHYAMRTPSDELCVDLACMLDRVATIRERRARSEHRKDEKTQRFVESLLAMPLREAAEILVVKAVRADGNFIYRAGTPNGYSRSILRGDGRLERILREAARIAAIRNDGEGRWQYQLRPKASVTTMPTQRNTQHTADRIESSERPPRVVAIKRGVGA